MSLFRINTEYIKVLKFHKILNEKQKEARSFSKAHFSVLLVFMFAPNESLNFELVSEMKSQ